MSRPNPKHTLALLCCGLLAAGSAYALKSDKGQPINIQADHVEFRADPSNDSNGTGIYTGHVVITQGSIKLTADKAVLHVVNNELDTADMSGAPATFQQQPDKGEMIQGQADEITYDASKNQIDLINNARLVQPVTQVGGVTLTPTAATARAPAGSTAPAPSQGERLLTADHIRYNTETQQMVATGSGEDGRVRITFPPKQLPGENAESAKQRHEAAPAARTHEAPAPTTHEEPRA
jgi:lipopolysaccharide export system protein LptA